MSWLMDEPIKNIAGLRSNAIDMTARRFGDWFVLGVASRRYYDSGGSQLYWWCRCLGCGQKAAVNGGALRGGTNRCFQCSRLVIAEKNRARSRRVGDGRTVAQIAQATGLKPDTVYHRLIRGWKRHEIGMRALHRGERRASP